MFQQRDRGFSAISRGSSTRPASNSQSNTPRSTTINTNTNKRTASPSNHSSSVAAHYNMNQQQQQRFTIPQSHSTPKVLHVFPATARQQVMQQQQQQQQQQISAATSRATSPLQRSATSPNRVQPRSSSPRSFLLNPHHASNMMTTSKPTSRANSPSSRNNTNNRNNTIVSPFRDVHSQPMSQTLDGRLLYLLKDFSTTVMPTQDGKVQNIASRLRRSKILTDKEMTVLETCHQRNANFMGTIEKILGEAVEQGVDMRRSVVHQAYEIWRACNDANSYIATLLDTAQSAIGVGKFSKTNVHGTGFNQSQKTITSAIGMMNNNGSRSGSAFHSPALSRGQSPVVGGAIGGRSGSTSNALRRYNSPSNFGQIARPDAPPRQQLAHFDQQYTRQLSQQPQQQAQNDQQQQQQNNNNNNPNNFSQAPTILPTPTSHNLAPSNLFIQAPPDLQTTLQQYQYQQYPPSGGQTRRSTSRGGATALQVGAVQVEDAREAQMMFEKLFGPEEGRTRFLHWLSELPESTIQQLHRSLTH